MKEFLLAIFLFSICVQDIYSYKILVFSPNFAFSHMNFMGKVADTLQLAGHNVTVVQPALLSHDKGTGVSHAKVISIPPIPEMEADVKRLQSPDFWSKIWTANTKNPMAVTGPLPLLSKLLKLECENLLKQTELLETLKNENFDLGITELFDFTAFPLFNKIELTNLVGAHTTGLFEATALAVGVPTIPSYVPASQGTTGDSGSLWERLVNLVFTFFSYKFETILADVAQEVMDREMPEAPRIWDTVSNMSFILTNSDPLLDFPKPTLEKIVDLGSIGLRKSKPLDKQWDSVLNLRSKTVLISFGSVAPSSTMPQATKESIIKVLKKFPDVTFIWKYETPEDGLGKGADNVILTKWQPQTDLLADPRLSLFVTHGGAGSIMESANFGVPLVTIPLFGDQMRNAQMVQRLGIAIAFDKCNLGNEASLENTLREALEDNRLRSTAKRMKRMLGKRPFSPQEKLLRTIDLAAEFGPMPNLAPSGRNMTFVQYFNIDIVFYAFLLVLFIVILGCLMLKSIWNKLTKSVKTKQQ